jgi:hypothetical protein
MDNIVLTKQSQAMSLTELAVQINAEHGHVETAVRNGLEHARQAGLLLLQAKTRVPYGNWLSWLETHCKVTSRTAQRYMEIAENWEQLVAKGGESLGLKGALKLLSRTDDPKEPNTTPVSYLPPALAYYHQKGVIDDDALGQLLELEQDYGLEILTNLCFSPPPEEIRDAWWLLNEIRPLDHPSLWPFPVKDETPGGIALTAATRIFLDDGHAREGKVPQWEVTAFWFGSTMMQFAAASPKFAEEFSSILRHHLKVWRESFRTALVVVGCLGPDFLKGDDAVDIYWGYRSDLRHAGALEAALEIKENPTGHTALSNSMEAGFDDIDQHGSYVLPSNMQGRLDHCTEIEVEDDDDSRGDAYEHPDDVLKGVGG